MEGLIVKSTQESDVLNFKYDLSDEYLDFDSKVLCNSKIDESLKIDFLKKDYEQEKPRFIISNKCDCIKTSPLLYKIIREKLISLDSGESSYLNIKLFNFSVTNNLDDASTMLNEYISKRETFDRRLKSRYKDSSIPARLFEIGEFDKALTLLDTLVSEVLTKKTRRIDDGINDLSNNPFIVLHKHESPTYRKKVEDLAFIYYWSVSKGLTTYLHEFLQKECSERYTEEYENRLRTLLGDENNASEFSSEIMKSRSVLGPSLGIELWNIFQENSPYLDEDGIANSLFLSVDITKNGNLTEQDKAQILEFILSNHPTISNQSSKKDNYDFDRYIRTLYALNPNLDEFEFEKLIPQKYSSTHNFKAYRNSSKYFVSYKDTNDIKQSIAIVKKYNSEFVVGGNWDNHELLTSTNRCIWFGSVDTRTPLKFRNIFTTHLLPYLINSEVLSIDLEETVNSEKHLVSVITPTTKFTFEEQSQHFSENMKLLIQSLNLALVEINNPNRFTFIDTGDENLMVVLLPKSETQTLIKETGHIEQTKF